MAAVLGVLGVTGITGSYIAQYGMEQGHKVVGLARFPSKLSPRLHAELASGKLRLVTGDAREASALEEVVKSSDVIFEATGRNHNRPTTVREDIAKLLVKFMRKHGKKRVLYISAAVSHEEGLAVVPPRQPAIHLNLGALLRSMKKMLAFMADNKDDDTVKAENVYRTAGPWLEWTVILPPSIVQKPPRRNIVTRVDSFPQLQDGSPMPTITFADMALMMLDSAANETFIRQGVYLNQPGKLGPGLRDVPKMADMIITNLLDKLLWPKLAAIRLGFLQQWFYSVCAGLGLVASHPKHD